MLDTSYLQTIFYNISEAFLVIDTQGIVLYSNPRLRSLLNLPLTVGKPLSEQVPSAKKLGFEAPDFQLLLDQLATGGWASPQKTAHYQLLTPFRMVIRRVLIPVWQEETLQGLVMIFADETETHDLRVSQDDLTSMIVHDLRSPLTAVTASLRLLRDIAEPEDSFGRIVLQTTDIAGRAVRRLLNLVNSILDVSKMESGAHVLETEPASLHSIVERVFVELSPLSNEMDVHLRADNLKAIPPIDVDSDKIERLFYNLIDNAIKFSPGDSEVTISARVIAPPWVQVQVRDSGTGIPDDQKSRIFDRYQQGSLQRRGTGLGLTYCKLTVEAHGGEIWIEDNPVGGSIFVFSLPLA